LSHPPPGSHFHLLVSPHGLVSTAVLTLGRVGTPPFIIGVFHHACSPFQSSPFSFPRRHFPSARQHFIFRVKLRGFSEGLFFDLLLLSIKCIASSFLFFLVDYCGPHRMPPFSTGPPLLIGRFLAGTAVPLFFFFFCGGQFFPSAFSVWLPFVDAPGSFIFFTLFLPHSLLAPLRLFLVPCRRSSHLFWRKRS